MEQLLIATKKVKIYSTDEVADATGLDKVNFINVKTDEGKQLQVKRSNIKQWWKRDTETGDLLVISKNVPPAFYPGNDKSKETTKMQGLFQKQSSWRLCKCWLRQYFYGCKCHALVSESGHVIDYTITPASMADSSMTEEVLSQFGTPTVLGDMGYLGQSLHDRLELKGIDLITPVRKNMKQKKILFPNFSKRRKVIERVFSFLTNLGAESCKSRSPQGFQLKLEMILLAYSLLLKSAKSLEPETLRYSIGYQVMAK